MNSPIVAGRAGVPERRDAAQLAGGQRPQAALALLVGAAERERQAGDRVREQRRGRQRVAHLLEEHGEVDDPEALAAPLLGQRQAGPAELGHLLPVGLLEAGLGVGELADPLRFVAGQQNKHIKNYKKNKKIILSFTARHLLQPRVSSRPSLGRDLRIRSDLKREARKSWRST